MVNRNSHACAVSFATSQGVASVGCRYASPVEARQTACKASYRIPGRHIAQADVCRLAMATMASTEDCEFLVATDLEAPDTSAASVQPDSGTPAEPRVIPALVVGFMAMALMAASLFLLDLEGEHQGKARWRLLQAAGGGSAVGSCWLKCGAAVGKAVHWIGTFIARTFASVGRCIHSIFASVNSGFGDCCGAVGHQLGRCPGCGGWCSHCWMASGRCMGGKEVLAPALSALTTAIDLASQGINAQAFKFNSLTMVASMGSVIRVLDVEGSQALRSDKYISIKDTAADGTAQVVVVDMHNNNAVSKRPMKAEATLMNPADNIIALKATDVGKAMHGLAVSCYEAATEGQAGHFVQIFNLDSKEKLGVYQCPEQIVFWRWLAPRLLALICAQVSTLRNSDTLVVGPGLPVLRGKDVYHWNLSVANSQPEKIFQRAGKLAEAGTQIINYSANSQVEPRTGDSKSRDLSEVSWCLLTGVERKQQQLLEGHAGCFGNVYVDDGGVRCGVFAFQAGNPQTKLHIMDILKNRGESAPPFKVQMEIAMPPEADVAQDLRQIMLMSGVRPYDLASSALSTEAGFLFMFDIGTGTMLVRSRVSQETVFITVGSALSGGMIFVNKRGAVMSAKANSFSAGCAVSAGLETGISMSITIMVMVVMERTQSKSNNSDCDPGDLVSIILTLVIAIVRVVALRSSTSSSSS
ncbi:Clathrin heavy chain [Symbiodinium microadriaticum]|uniref:Clathrin heavy chain n=1 Tax=Symbiodinium microadriaticum TaxID=2951 RepID=A0A1Q9EER4_SYMMI|nr:Clathrin heavy chain [Symbiodinium microadriaticum]